MTPQTQLLCTFTNVLLLDDTITTIKNTYDLQFNRIYVLENTDDTTQLIVTYNVCGYLYANSTAPDSTISVHRKKATNTIYTINALNKLIEEKNGGVLDARYPIDWVQLKNTILVVAYSKLKLINTKLSKIVELTT
jgi:hypothetical protein